MILHCFPASHNSRKVLALIDALELPVERRIVNLLAKETFTPAFRAKNPNGLAPVLEDGAFKLWESNAILMYLAAKRPDSGWWPQDGHGQADVARWLFWQIGHWDAGLDPIAIERMVKPLEGGGDPDPVVIAMAEAKVAKCAPVLDGHLAGRAFVAGDKPTIADLALASSLQYHHLAGYPLEGFSNIWRWYKDMFSLPCWRSSQPDWAALGLPADPYAA